MSLYKSWVHGNAMVLEGGDQMQFRDRTMIGTVYSEGTSASPARITGESHTNIMQPYLPPVSMMNYGSGAVVKMQRSNTRWFHIPLPTPAIYDDTRLQMTRFFLLWKIVGPGSLEYVHLYDAGRLINAKFKNIIQGPSGLVQLQEGDHTSIDNSSTFELSDPVANGSGYGISFQLMSKDGDVEMTITAAGADFTPFVASPQEQYHV